MVTFNCEVCNDTVAKKNTEKHYNRCPDAYYTCIDCNVTFEDGVSYKKHTQCISEDEKYQKSMYKQKKAEKPKPAKQATQAAPKAAAKPPKKPAAAAKFKLVPGKSLYKIAKALSKDEKKELLKRLTVTPEGTVVLQD